MKFSIKSILIFSILLVGLTALQAQRGGGQDWDPNKRAEQQTATMTEKLSLSEAQAGKVKEINLKYGQKMQEIRTANPEGDWTTMRELFMKMRQEQETELKTVLTTEQYENWIKYQEEQRKQRGNWNGGN